MYDMAILGGGIAGLTAGILAQLQGKNAIIFDYKKSILKSGHGFILQKNGMDVLDQLKLGSQARSIGHKLTHFELRSAGGRLLYQKSLEGSYGFLRKNFLLMLKSMIDPAMLHTNKPVKNIRMVPNTKLIDSIMLADDSTISAHLFIDAEGKKSLLRKCFFPNVQGCPGRVSEILCTIHSPDIARQLTGQFIKFQHEKGSLSVGLVPCNDNNIVWYCQFNTEIYSNILNTPHAIKTFIYQNLADWCPLIQKVINYTDFNSAYLWHTEDFDRLPYLHGENSVLVGDAAHLFLPFTSQGVSSALQDIHVLSQSLLLPCNLPKALEHYTQSRMPELKRILQRGRELRDKFLQHSLKIM